jgi:4-amino-4-deoxy-L-arabinose transferase-like glycosyltransferase
MTSKLIKKKAYILLFSILLIGFVLRAHNLTTWPRVGATFDEFAWTWLGISLIKEQVPSSWSPHSAYIGHRKAAEYQNAKFWIVKPYLEHPPFFGLVAGSFSILRGADSLFEVTIEKIRPLALILGVFSIFLLFMLVKELYDERTALLAALIYATVPTIVIGSRIVQNENFFIPFFLLSLFLIFRFIKSKNSRYRNIAAIICGLLIISKVPWAAASLAVFAILFYKNKYIDAFKFMCIVIPIFLLYIAYGLYFNSEIFINLWQLQLQRYDLTFNSVYALFTEPFLADRYLVDGWIYIGWISFFLLLIKDFKQNYILIFGLLAYLGVFIFAIPNEPGHGWYRYPFYPFLAISIALFIREYFNKNIILTFLFTLFLGVSLLEISYKVQYGFSFKVFRLFLISTLICLLPLFFKGKFIKRLSFRLNTLLLCLLFSLNFWAVLEYNEQ